MTAVLGVSWMADYERALPNSHRDLGRRKTLSEWLHLDLLLLAPLLALMLGGLLVLYSASDADWQTVVRQGRNQMIGLVAMALAAQFRVDTYRRWSHFLYGVGFFLLLAVPWVGVGAKGAQRWLSLGVVQFQPSELMKLAMPLMMAWWFSRYTMPPRLWPLLGSLMVMLLPVVLIGIQPDLGTSLLVAASGLIVLFLAGLSGWYIVAASLLGVASVWPAWHFVLKDYQRQRIITLLDPEADKLGAGWNIIQSKTAIGSGGWGGKGWLSGTQSHLDFLPESQTDFIIAVLAEEFGLQGVLLLLGLYLLVIMRGFWIGLHAQSGFARLLASAITFTFFVYVFVNMGMVAGILPVVGVPLPLVSFGGTSMVTLMLAFGVLMAISTEQRSLSA